MTFLALLKDCGTCVCHDCDYSVTFFRVLVVLMCLQENSQTYMLIRKSFNKESAKPLKKVTKISTVYEVLSKKPTSKKCFLEIHKLL